MTNFTQVGEFMTTFGQEVVTVPAHPSTSVANLRLDLIQEEVDELTYAIDNNNLVEIADALTDILYVVYGAGHAYGIDLDKCFDEVHASNMSKLNEEGKPIHREDGKVLKGSNYFEPNLSQFLFERSETGHP